MSQDEIIAMAREAGFVVHEPAPATIWGGRECSAELVRFAALVAAREREGCAHLCDEICAAKGVPFYGLPGMKGSAQECAAAIRARLESKP